MRTVLTPKRDEARNILDVVCEFRSAMETVNPLVTIPLGGDIDMVRTIVRVASLGELEALGKEATSDKMKPYLERISVLTLRAPREFKRVEYRSQG